jgi:cysteine protease ATG4
VCIGWRWQEKTWERTLGNGLDLALLRVPSSACFFFFAALLHSSFLLPRTLAHAFPEAGIGVSIASDGVIFQSDVFAASNPDVGHSIHGSQEATSWGTRAVLVLIGIRLGLDGVNPIYYDSIKVTFSRTFLMVRSLMTTPFVQTLYTFPQSVGIAGGRPSSSYYFVGSQGDGLFYLDPHHPRLAIPLRLPPAIPTHRGRRSPTMESGSDQEQDSDHRYSSSSSGNHNHNHNHHRRRASPHQRVSSPRSPSSIRSSTTGSSTFSYHAPASPSPLQHQLSASSAGSSSQEQATAARPAQPTTVYTRRQQARTGSSSSSSSSRVQTTPVVSPLETTSGGADRQLDELQTHYVSAYSPVELKTYHCDRVRKLPLSGLDPSMLIGFLCKDEQSWIDLRARVNDVRISYI